jgi:YHS domain-containing protein
MKMKYAIACLIFLLGQLVYAQDVAKRNKNFNTDNKLAISGYDPVSYFSNKPDKGKKELAYTYEGIIYQFSSQTNQDAFKSNPAKYEPAYGGWCAYAMGDRGEKVEVDPETFKIIDGRVYLFYNKFFTNTLPNWNKDESSLKKKADTYWIAIIK